MIEDDSEAKWDDIDVMDIDRIRYRILQKIKKNDKLLRVKQNLTLNRMTTDALRRIPLKVMISKGL